MIHPICLLLGAWRSLRRMAWVSGHDFVELDDTPPNVSVLECTRCGTTSVGWSWSPLREEAK